MSYYEDEEESKQNLNRYSYQERISRLSGRASHKNSLYQPPGQNNQMMNDTIEQPIYQQNPMYNRLDSLPLKKWHIFAILALSGGLFLDGYEVAIVAVSSEELQRVYDASQVQIGLLGTSYMIGAGVGSLLFGYYAFKHGRKKLFYTTLMIYAVSILFVIISRNFSLEQVLEENILLSLLWLMKQCHQILEELLIFVYPLYGIQVLQLQVCQVLLQIVIQLILLTR